MSLVYRVTFKIVLCQRRSSKTLLPHVQIKTIWALMVNLDKTGGGSGDSSRIVTW